MSKSAKRVVDGGKRPGGQAKPEYTNTLGVVTFALVAATTVILAPPHEEAKAGIPVDAFAVAKPLTAVKSPFDRHGLPRVAMPVVAKAVGTDANSHVLPAIKIAKKIEPVKSARRIVKDVPDRVASSERSRPKIGWKGSKGSYKNVKKNSNRKVKVAALHRKSKTDASRSRKKKRKSLTGGRKVQWSASPNCLNKHLRKIMYEVAVRFGKVRVNSTCRSKKHNRRVGGAPRSQHLTGSAVDFRVFGNYRGAWQYVRARSGVGGHKHYGGGLFHIDVGPRRTW